MRIEELEASHERDAAASRKRSIAKKEQLVILRRQLDERDARIADLENLACSPYKQAFGPDGRRFSVNSEARITNLAYLGVKIPEESLVGDDHEAHIMRAVVGRQDDMARMGLEGAGRAGPTTTGGSSRRKVAPVAEEGEGE